MNKLRVWCSGGRREVKAKGRSNTERCSECGQRFRVTEVHTPVHKNIAFMIPPHKAY